MQRSIPNPLVLLFSYENALCVGLAEKRINQSYKEKWVVEESYSTDWINLEEPTTQQTAFLAGCNINNFSFSNCLAFYKSIQDRVTALNCAAYTGVHELNKLKPFDGPDDKRNTDRVTYLKELEKLNLLKAEIINRSKRRKTNG